MNETNQIPEFLEIPVVTLTLNKTPRALQGEFITYEVAGESQPGTDYSMSLAGTNPGLEAGDIICFSEDNTAPRYRLKSVSNAIINGLTYVNLIYENTEDAEAFVDAQPGQPVYKVTATTSATAEAPGLKATEKYNEYDYKLFNHTVANFNAFAETKQSLPFVNESAKLKFFAKSPGTWGNAIDVAIARPEDFDKGLYITEGIPLDGIFDYLPWGDQFAVIVLYANEIMESYIVSLDELAKNDKGEFIYIETLINGKSEYILVNVNEGLDDDVKSALGDNIIKLFGGVDSEPGIDDIVDAYTIFDNKEEIDVDILIANEVYPNAAIEIAIKRADCIAFVGAPRSASVGLKATLANEKTLEFRKNMNVDSMFVTLCSNYKYQYCTEMGGYRWINLAGDIAGLKAQTNFNQANWFAAAGLNRGLIKNCEKLAYSPTNAMRDALYKNGINPVVMFPNTGAVLWGQKTLQTKASSFDRVNVVSLFNHLERSLGRMSKYSLFEFNDEFTRNYLVSIIKPFLAQVKAGRGIQDYLVICDTSNNTPDIISRNELVLDCYIKSTYVAEFIHLRFTNVGVNDFSVVVQ